MNNIEVEIRCFISLEKYQELLAFFHREGEFLNEDYQETYYFEAEHDLRIQKNNSFSKVVLKSGKVHDYHRKEIEVKFERAEFEKLESLFATLGYPVAIKWFRKRHNFKWQDIDISLDFTKGYGYILELEKMSDEQHQEQNLRFIREKLKLLQITETFKEEFDQIYKHYLENWQRLIKE